LPCRPTGRLNPETEFDMTDWYAEIAAELHRMADDLNTLAGNDLPKPWLNLNIQPHGHTDEQIITAVDAVAGVLIGKPGRTMAMSDGDTYHHDAHGYRGPISVGVYNRVSNPATRERDAAVERLRAELAALRATAETRRCEPTPVIVLHDETAKYPNGFRKVTR
jgi:hypothetical protein